MPGRHHSGYHIVEFIAPLRCTLAQRILLIVAITILVIPDGGVSFRVPRTFNPRSSTKLYRGYGIAEAYRWSEEAYEIEVTVRVPRETRAKDVVFTPTTRSVGLYLRSHNKTLLDGNRPLRGRVNLDGTYWVISDPDDATDDYREVTVTIEKLHRTPRDDFEVIEYDWKGVYISDAAEVVERKYDEPEVLDVREYAASLGVDIDNMNMSLVDKSMFSSGLNITKSSLDELNKAGLIKEITRQADGSEYELDDEGNPIPTSPLTQDRKSIPFVDTNSPWHTAVPVQVDRETNQTFVQQKRNFTRAAFAQDSATKHTNLNLYEDAKDPIDTLTVKRLREILKSQGLKVSGTKKELQERLRRQVNSLLQGKPGGVKEDEENDDDVT